MTTGPGRQVVVGLVGLVVLSGLLVGRLVGSLVGGS